MCVSRGLAAVQLALVAGLLWPCTRGKTRGEPECWNYGFTWEQCCHYLHGPRGNPTCWDGSKYNFEFCCRGEVFKPAGCSELVAHFDFSVMKLNPDAWEVCVDTMERFPDRCNSRETTQHSCPECVGLSVHFIDYIRCVKTEQTRTLKADGSASEDTEAPKASVSGVHYPALYVPRTEGRDFVVAAPAFDAYVGNRLVVDGMWMHHEIQLLTGLSRPGEVVVDAGANIGGFTLPLAKHVGRTGKVYAFEPFRLLFQCLNANVMLNGLDNVHTFQMGLSNRTEVIRAKQPNLNTISNPSKMHVSKYVANTMMIRRDPRPDVEEPLHVGRLDDVDFGGRGPSLIKVDVESMEVPLMYGAVRTLRRFRPTMYIEDSEGDGTRGPTTLMRFLYEQGFISVDLAQSGFVDATSMLFVARERHDEMMQRLHTIKWTTYT